jgi:8-hydroxy-5-deazaflavin:NADPH oxidoreductase
VERVAVVGGTGAEGFGLALRWARAGIEIIIGSRDEARAAAAAERLGGVVSGARVEGAENPEAVASAGVVVVTVPFAGQVATYRSIAPRVGEDTVVVDCTAPLAAATGGRASHVLGVWQGSAAQQAAAHLERGRLCAAFHSLSASALHDLDHELDGDVLVCGPRAAKPVVAGLVDAIPGLGFVDAGPLDNARLVEPLTALLVGLNRRYGTDRAGIRITGLP